jgi:hypothetical protein
MQKIECSSKIVDLDLNPWKKKRMKNVVVRCEGCASVFAVFYDHLLPSPYYTCPQCGRCYPLDHNIIHHVKRTPALGWDELTVLEALCDSAKTLIQFDNIPKAQSRLNKMLQVLRNRIAKTKQNTKTLIPRCEYRETTQTRCNKSPAKLTTKGYRCSKHLGDGYINEETLHL